MKSYGEYLGEVEDDRMAFQDNTTDLVVEALGSYSVDGRYQIYVDKGEAEWKEELYQVALDEFEDEKWRLSKNEEI